MIKYQYLYFKNIFVISHCGSGVDCFVGTGITFTGVGVAVGATYLLVGTNVGVAVGVSVGVAVRVGVITVGVFVGITGTVGVNGIGVAVPVGVTVLVGVTGCLVLVAVAVGVLVGVTGLGIGGLRYMKIPMHPIRNNTIANITIIFRIKNAPAPFG